MSSKGLPEGWIQTTLGEIRIDLHKGINPSKFSNQKFELYSVPCFETGKPEVIEGKTVGSNKQIVKEDTVLLCKINPRINRVWIVGKYSPLEKIASTEWIPFFKIEEIEPKYLCYFMQNPTFRQFLTVNVSGVGGSLMRVKPSTLVNYPIPLPPLPEQHQIVARLEELFSDLDDGIASLKKAQEQLTTYRQAVLKYAFEGKLTAEWGKQHQPESAETLLEQIKTGRERQYQHKLDEWQQTCEQATAAGKKKPPKPKKPKDLPPLTEAELAKLPELPEGWCWVRLLSAVEDIFDGPFGSNLKTKDYVDSGIRVIRLENIGSLEFDDKKKSFITEQKYETLKKHTVSAGDIVFSSFMSDQTRVIVLPEHIKKAVNKADCFCVRVFHKHLSNKFLASFLSTRLAYNLLAHKVHGATRPRINTKQLKNCTIPLCSIEEQHQIVQEIEARLSVCDRLEQTIADSLQKAESLRQSILKQAFEGKLTEPWRKAHPNLISGEHSAAALLERIQAEKEKLKTEKNAKQMKLL